jgi:hypothetical protein
VRLPRVEREEVRFLTRAEVARPADAIGPSCRALEQKRCFACSDPERHASTSVTEQDRHRKQAEPAGQAVF